MRIPVNTNERNKRINGKPESSLFSYYGATGQVGYIDDYIFSGKYVLLGEDGAPFLDSSAVKAYIINGKFWVNNHVHILNSYISPEFLCHVLNTIDYAKYVNGSTRLKLTQIDMQKIMLLIPPLNEQKRIVEKIESIFKLIHPPSLNH
jgi:type I restriction enzyme S subunit